MSNSLDIQSVHFYQAVKINGKTSIFFSKTGNSMTPPVELSIIDNVGVKIDFYDKRTKELLDSAIVPYPNIGTIYLNTKKKEAVRSERRAEIENPGSSKKALKDKIA